MFSITLSQRLSNGDKYKYTVLIKQNFFRTFLHQHKRDVEPHQPDSGKNTRSQRRYTYFAK